MLWLVTHGARDVRWQLVCMGPPWPWVVEALEFKSRKNDQNIVRKSSTLPPWQGPRLARSAMEKKKGRPCDGKQGGEKPVTLARFRIAAEVVHTTQYSNIFVNLLLGWLSMCGRHSSSVIRLSSAC